MPNTALRTLVITAVLVIGAVACGDDDGADVRTIGEGGAASASAGGSASGVAAADKECAAVGEDLESEADETVEIALRDYGFDPDQLDVAAGVVRFATSNEGQEAHELAFLPGGGDVPLTDDGAPDEDALAEQGAFELEAYGPGQDCNATYEIEPGEYTIFCIVEAADGETHAEKGMVGTVTVN